MFRRLMGTAIVLVLTLFGFVTLTADAQGGLDYTQPPAFGEATLVSGFEPDPYEVAIVAGGPVDVNATVGSACDGAANGYAASAPDFRLQYTEGDYLLRFMFAGEGDTSLVVSAPDGSWHCDDDGGGLYQPLVEFGSPMGGQYDIWVAVVNEGEVLSGTLYISEMAIMPAVDMPEMITIPTGAPGKEGSGPAGLTPNAVLGSNAIDVVAGFESDPIMVDATAGGLVDAAVALGGVCQGAPIGFISPKPNLRVNYAPGDYALTFFYYNQDEEDTTMVVQAPDGTFYCDDDTSGLLQPAVSFAGPQAGVYNVWMGSYSAESFVRGFVLVTELDMTAQDVADQLASNEASVAGGLDWRMTPTYGETTLASGFSPDPHELPIVAGGSIDVSLALGGLCQGPAMGYAAAAPDYRLNYTAGQYPLRIFFAGGGEDTTLAVNAPDGNWYCSDDEADTLDGMVIFDTPSSGQYDIWIGTFAQGAYVNGTLYITELALDPANTGGK
jgi:hypothetical protein